jgi:putative transposase
VGGFVYVPIILDAAGRGICHQSRLTLAALAVSVESRTPPPGCVHHSDCGSQYAAVAYREFLANQGLDGSMGRRGNPYDNAKAESFMKTLTIEAVYPMAFETFADVAPDLP